MSSAYVRITRIVTEHGDSWYRATELRFPEHIVTGNKDLAALIAFLDEQNYSIVNAYEKDGNTYKIKTKYE